MIIANKIYSKNIDRLKITSVNPTHDELIDINEYNELVDTLIDELLYRKLSLITKYNERTDRTIVENTARLHYKTAKYAVECLKSIVLDDVVKYANISRDYDLMERAWIRLCEEKNLDWYSYYRRVYNE